MTAGKNQIKIPYTAVILDPGMFIGYGHNFNYNTILHGGFLRNGIPVEFILPSMLHQDLRKFFPNAVFGLETNFYATAVQFNTTPLPEFMEHAAQFADELERVFTPRPNQLLFAHTLDPLRFVGVALWHSRLPEHKKIRLALNVMLGIDSAENARAKLKPATRIFANDDKVRMFGGTKAITDILSELSGRPCSMLPTPLPGNLDEILRSNRPNQADGANKAKGPLFGIIGDARRGKNLHLLPAAIIKYLRRGGKGNFLLQLTPSEVSAHPEVIALHELCTMFPERITLSLDRLSEDDYYTCLSSLSAILLPYSPMAYTAYRPSGPTIEATALGVPVLSCAGGFIEGELAPLDNGSIFVERESPDELAEAMFTFEREAEARKQQAEAAAVSYRRFHSMENIIRMIGLDPEQG